MKIFITGGSGFFGRTLTARLRADRHDITIVDRRITDPSAFPAGLTGIEADTTKPGDWQAAAAASEIVVNLAGTPIFNRWSKAIKRSILESRVLTTRNIVEALASRKKKTKRLINASAVGYYGFLNDEIVDETFPPGADFLATVARAWEDEAVRAREHAVDVTACRFGIILGKGGGALALLKKIYRLRAGSRLGGGRQWFPWVHEDDLAELVAFIIKHRITGAVNCTAPVPVRNAEMTRQLNRALGVFPLVPPAPAFAVKLILGEFGETLLRGQRAFPRVLTERGFEFRYPEFERAIRSLA